MSKWQKCFGKYVVDDPCYPFCSLPDGSGCDYSAMIDTGSSNPFGLTSQYSVQYGDDPVTGNYSTRVYTPVIDPYQVQVPPNNFDGMRKSFDGGGADCPEAFHDNYETVGFHDNYETGFKSANGGSPESFNFQVVPSFDHSNFFNDNAPTKYRWRVFS